MTVPGSSVGACLVVNGRARDGKEVFERARNHLVEGGVRLVNARLVEDPADLVATIEAALGAGSDLIVIGGGDGTLSSASAVLRGSTATLGVIPLGTANDSARSLNIPLDVELACEVVSGGHVTDIDVGLAGDATYLNVASIGLGAAVAAAVSHRTKQVLGPAAYPVAALRAAATTRPFAADLTFATGGPAPVHFAKVVQIAVGNGRFYGGGRAVSATAGIDDGTLDVYVVTANRPTELARVARRLKSGDFSGLSSTSGYRTTEVLVATDPPQAVNLDGELPGLMTPVRLTVARNALRVLVAPGSTAARLDDGSP